MSFLPFRGVVRPEWVDDNGHMNLAFYLVLFDGGSDAVFERLGIGARYRREAGCTPFAAETHLVYEREMKLGDEAVISSTVIGVDEKRLHLAHEMRREWAAARVCLREILFINVDLGTRQAAPWPEAALARLRAARGANEVAPAPAKLGRRIGLPGG